MLRRRWGWAVAPAMTPLAQLSFTATSKRRLHFAVNTTSTVPAADETNIALLQSMLSRKQMELQRQQQQKVLCDAAARQHPDALMRRIFLFLVLQAAVLFDWTYIHFDWNLVEPITYLIGYSATWIALGWYGAVKSEFSYDTLQEAVEERYRVKLYRQHDFHLERYEKLKNEVAVLEKVIRGMKRLEMARAEKDDGLS